MKNFKLNAFTLAEVLITLGIIGVVAALTIPVLLKSYKKKVTTTRLKTFYSIMSQAITIAENEHGLKARDWDSIKSNEDAYNYWIKYLSHHIKTLKIEKGSAYKSTKVYFPDGSTLELKPGRCVDLHLDINGDKYPNKCGQDIYYFFITTNSAVEGYEISQGHSFGVVYLPYYNTIEQALAACIKNPCFCSAYLKYTNFEFTDNYPYKL